MIKTDAGIDIPRSEYPRPQFLRSDWLCLNGNWTFEFDFAKTGMERRLYKSTGFRNGIVVPFCPESRLSGIAYKDFIDAMWYHRRIEIPAFWADRKIRLNFGAVDYRAEIFIDGHHIGSHWGACSSFGFDISDYVRPGHAHDLVVYVIDATRDVTQPSGKQSMKYHSHGCYYTRVTGIWQSVWLEPVHQYALKECRVITDIDNSRIIFMPSYYRTDSGYSLKATLYETGEKIADMKLAAVSGACGMMEINRPRLWSPVDPFLYEIKYEVSDPFGNIIDSVSSYTGLRKIHIEDDRIFLNNKPLFQRLVLDQGYYPDGIWTAPTDEALKQDIQLGLEAGFNGARLHQKVFEERYLYWADKLGYLVWAESPSWGGSINYPATGLNFLAEWAEVIVRDRNHPCVITWTPFNETWERREDNGIIHNKILTDAYHLTHTLDGTRPVNDTCGHFHVKTDLWTVHIYDQDSTVLKNKILPADGGVYFRNAEWESKAYKGQPYLLAEFGGIKWSGDAALMDMDQRISWGYGDAPKDIEEFYDRLEKLVAAVLSVNTIRGYCYTQLTDVEQEHNGIYFYDRRPKFDMKRIRKIFSKCGSEKPDSGVVSIKDAGSQHLIKGFTHTKA